MSITANLIPGFAVRIFILLNISFSGFFFFFDFSIEIVSRIAKILKINVFTVVSKKED